jgi:STE24 endopeptidase
LSSIADLAALPLLGLWLTLFGSVTSPLGNWISRRHERQADIYAVRASGKTDAFASALRKLSNQNLADPDPHPVVEFLFYSHPAIAKRIALVESIVA